MKLTSPAFYDVTAIPEKYTCKGANVSPPLAVADVPSNAQSLVLIVEDPDAPFKTFDHWLMWNISPDTVVIIEGTVPPGAVQGTNSFGNKNYGGPCPPTGTHRYVFKLYALDTTLTLPVEAKKEDLEAVMTGHILGQTKLTGLYPL